MGMRIFIAVSSVVGQEWQVEVDLGTCRARIHRGGAQVAQAIYHAGEWLDVEPAGLELHGVLTSAAHELRPFQELLRRRCRGSGGAG
jgi:hypothetical protein